MNYTNFFFLIWMFLRVRQKSLNDPIPKFSRVKFFLPPSFYKVRCKFNVTIKYKKHPKRMITCQDLKFKCIIRDDNGKKYWNEYRTCSDFLCHSQAKLTHVCLSININVAAKKLWTWHSITLFYTSAYIQLCKKT